MAGIVIAGHIIIYKADYVKCVAISWGTYVINIISSNYGFSYFSDIVSCVCVFSSAAVNAIDMYKTEPGSLPGGKDSLYSESRF